MLEVKEKKGVKIHLISFQSRPLETFVGQGSKMRNKTQFALQLLCQHVENCDAMLLTVTDTLGSLHQTLLSPLHALHMLCTCSACPG